MPATVHIGTSGWSYNHWEGVVYPPGTRTYHRLPFYLQHFRTVELNASFYRWPRDAAFDSWYKRLPEGFLLSLKAPRFLTHNKRLYGPEDWIDRIVAAINRLHEKAGILLVQLSPHFSVDQTRLAFFLERISYRVRIAVEFRHPSWVHESVFQVLEQYGAAYCVMSGAQLPCILRATAPFVYVRLHGPDTGYLYAGSYSDDDLRWWAGRIHEWSAQNREVYVYFNNDWEGHAVRNAHRLIELVSS